MPVIPVEGTGVVVTRKADVDEVFRHPEIFSSNADAVDLKNLRPLIPLQIDPPDHKKYRKLLDPIFAPREVAMLEESVTAAVNELIDRFIDRGEVDFATEFSTLFPTRVFLDLLGPALRRAAPLPRHEGRDHPPRRGRSAADFGSAEAMAYQQADGRLHLRLLQRDPRPAGGRAPGRPAEPVPRRRASTASELTREDILDICFLFLIAGLDTVTATLDCMFAYLADHPEQRRQIVDDPSHHPGRHRGAAPVGDPGDGRGPGGHRGHRDGGLPGPQGRQRDGHARLGQHRRGRPARRRRGPVRPRGQPAPGLRRRRAPLPRAPTWPAWSCGWPCASGTGGSPSTRWPRATPWSTRRASGRSTTSRWSSPAGA